MLKSFNIQTEPTQALVATLEKTQKKIQKSSKNLSHFDSLFVYMTSGSLIFESSTKMITSLCVAFCGADAPTPFAISDCLNLKSFYNTLTKITRSHLPKIFFTHKYHINITKVNENLEKLKIYAGRKNFFK